jgi:hypothetical protein
MVIFHRYVKLPEGKPWDVSRGSLFQTASHIRNEAGSMGLINGSMGYDGIWEINVRLRNNG